MTWRERDFGERFTIVMFWLIATPLYVGVLGDTVWNLVSTDRSGSWWSYLFRLVIFVSLGLRVGAWLKKTWVRDHA